MRITLYTLTVLTGPIIHRWQWPQNNININNKHYKPQRHKTYIKLCILDWRQARWSQIDSRIIIYRMPCSGSEVCARITQYLELCKHCATGENEIRDYFRKLSETNARSCIGGVYPTADNGQRRHAASDCVRQRTHLTAPWVPRQHRQPWSRGLRADSDCQPESPENICTGVDSWRWININNASVFQFSILSCSCLWTWREILNHLNSFYRSYAGTCKLVVYLAFLLFRNIVHPLSTPFLS